MKGMGNMMKQAQKLQSQMLKMQEGLADQTVEAAAGGGMVKVVANGRQQVISIQIEKEVVDQLVQVDQFHSAARRFRKIQYLPDRPCYAVDLLGQRYL